MRIIADMNSFLQELKRRSVFKVGTAYAVVAWLVIQIMVTVSRPLHLPDWADTLFIVLLALGFPVSLVLAWAYEVTPEGIKPDRKGEPEHDGEARGRAPLGGRKWSYLIVAVALAGLAFAAVKYGLVAGSSRSMATATSAAESTAPLPERPSVAVLPFANLSDEPSQEYFADGLTDDLTTDLSKMSGLFVISRNSAFTFKGKEVRADEVAEQLGVRYVVVGSVRRDADTVRVNAQLVEGSTGRDLWADRYDRKVTDLFAVQDDVVAQIVSSLAVRLTDSEQIRLERQQTPEFEAYDLYLQARETFFGTDPARLQKSLELFERSWNADPMFARAYAGYARAAVDVWRETSARVMANPLAKKAAQDAAEHALALDPLLADAHSVLALLSLGDNEHEDAIESAQLAIDLDPNSTDARTVLAIVLGYAGQAQAALDAASTAMRLDPRPSPYVATYYGWALFLNRRFEEAVDVLRPIAAENLPYNDLGDAPQVILASAYAELGRLDEAREQVDALRRQLPFLNLAHYRLVYSRHARDEDARYRLDALRKAGMPEWPLDFHGDPAQRLRGGMLENLIVNKKWSGTDRGRELPFIEEFGAGGTVAYHAETTFMTGTAYVENDELCERFQLFYWGRDACGPVYRGAAANQYTYVNSATVREFSLVD